MTKTRVSREKRYLQERLCYNMPFFPLTRLSIARLQILGIYISSQSGILAKKKKKIGSNTPVRILAHSSVCKSHWRFFFCSLSLSLSLQNVKMSTAHRVIVVMGKLRETINPRRRSIL